MRYVSLVGLSFLLAWSLLACGNKLTCGPGTTLKNNSCIPTPYEGGNEPTPERVADAQESQTEPQTPDTPTPEPSPEPTIAKVGEACKQDKDCEKGPCLRDGYCTDDCKTNEDCPVGMQCRQLSHQQPDGTWKTFTGCIRPTQTQKLCTRDADCPSEQVCVLSLSPSGDALIRHCAPAVPGGAKTGEACNPAKGIQCRTHLCANDAYCSALCAENKDCPEPLKCLQRELPLPDGRQVPIQVCVHDQIKCTHDAECPVGNVCQALVNEDQNAFVFLCQPVNRQGATAGKACDPNDAKYGCYNNLCIDQGFCFGICENDSHCPDGFRCVDAESQLPKGKAKFKGCIPKYEACKRSADCPSGLVCTVGTNQDQTKLNLFCNIPPLHSLPPGSVCTPNSTDPKQRCQNSMCIGEGYCSALCQEDKDCPTDQTCAQLTIQMKDGTIQTISGCRKP